MIYKYFEDERAGLQIENSIYPVVNEHGDVTRLAIYGRDITGRGQIEIEREKLYQQIHRAKREWEITVDSLTQIVCVLDRDGCVLRVSRAIERWDLGTVHAALGLDWHRLLHPDCQQADCYLRGLWHDAVQMMDANNLPVAREVRDEVLRRHLRIEIQPFVSLHDEMGESAGFAVVNIHDVSDRNRTQESLARYATRIEIVRRIYQSVLTAQSIEAIATAVLDHIWQLVRCQWANVVVLDVEERLCRVVAEWPAGQTPFAPGAVVPLGDREREKLESHDHSITLSILQQMSGHQQKEWEGRTLIVPLIARGEMVGILNLAGIGADALSDEIAGIAREVGDQLALALADARLFRSVSEQRQQLQTLAARMAEMQEAERRRLASELHDRVGQNLTALGINLNIVRSQLPGPLTVAAESRLDATVALLEETVDHIRDVMAELRPPVLDDYGVLSALRWYAQRFAYFTGVTTLVEGDESPRLPQATEIALFRIAQEALTNVAKHAHAQQVTVKLEMEMESQLARLTIVDNGNGFDVINTRRSATRIGWGLVTMQERAAAVGGHLRVESAFGAGTRVVIEVPR